MYIKKISSNKDTFRTVSFEKGFNVVLAERAEDSSERDSRNGLGKSTLIEIIHFCLGADAAKGGLDVPELKDWIFTLVFELNGKEFTVSREVGQPDVIFVEGDFEDWTTQPVLDELHKAHILTNQQWCEVLGKIMFGLLPTKRKYAPTFRTLISYFIRRGIDAYSHPLTFFKMQSEWIQQVNNAYLLGLGFEYASRFQELKDELDEIKQVKKATGKGYFKDLMGSIGELEAERVTKTQEIIEFKTQLESFKVHPQYHKIQARADALTQEIQETLNARHLEDVLRKRYSGSSEEEGDISFDLVESVYKEAGINFAEKLQKNLKLVSDFHKTILNNRKSYLGAEIKRLTQSIQKKDERITALSEERAESLSILHSHGALDEHARLSGQLALAESELETVKMRIKNLKDFEERHTTLEIQKKDLVRLAKQDKEERAEVIDAAIALFNDAAKVLYETGGTLAINIKDTGYSFKADIQRGRSQGVRYMKVFCYDLMLAQLHARFFKTQSLIHDSTVFDGVDERQFARALELAANKSTEAGFQYICTLNSDVVPYNEFSEAFKGIFEKSIRLKLTDSSPAGSLLGVRLLDS